MIAIPIVIGCLCVAATPVVLVLAPRRDRYLLGRVPESHAPLLTARLIPSPRAIAGRPPAAGTARPVHVITDAPWRNQAPGRMREGGQ